MLQTKSVKPYLPYAKGVKITWHKFVDKYGNRYPDGSLYNSGRVGEGELVYPSAEIIEPLLPLPKDYKVSIESTIGIYGTGLLDAIPDEAILAEYRRQHALAGPVKGIHGNWIYDHKSKRKRFLTEFIKKGYRVYTAPVTIGREEAGESTWFHGYNEKFFHDRGVLYHYLYGWLEWPLALRFLYAHKGTLCTEVSLQQAKQWMREGIREAGRR